MGKNNCQWGDVVRVIMPATYGVITYVQVDGQPQNPKIHSVDIKFMKPVYGLAGIGRNPVTTSTYRLDGYFGNKFIVIDPKSELEEITTERKTPNGASLEDAKEFLSGIVNN